MSKVCIDEIQICNFKFFNEQAPIKLDGKHLLLFGENGSGKSSVYWSLYTLFEASVKYDVEEIKKYFRHSSESEESLLNIHAEPIYTGESIFYDSFIKVTTTNNPPVNYEVSLLDTTISTNPNAVEVNQASDFLNYKVLYKFQDFSNAEPIDLANIFEGHILPYVKFSSFDIWRDGILQPRTNAIEMWQEIKMGPGTTTNAKGKTIQVYKYSQENKLFERFSSHFENQMQDLIDFINVNAPLILNKLGYDIGFELRYSPHTHQKADVNYYCNPFKIQLVITSYLGNPAPIHRPHSFLNEAKITAIAIAIRLAVLRKRINEEVPNLLKFIVFDDVMISLDMNNRDKLIDFLLNEENRFTKDYQLIFLTHDKNLYDFVAFKIKKLHDSKEWVFKEMYSGKDETTNREYPILIDSDLEFIDKANKYYKAKDYTTSSIFIRKELEKIVNDRLPNELKYKSDGSFLSLQTLWVNMVSRYSALNNPISDDIKQCFEETKLMVLNPQAHFQHISMPIYKVELDKAFQLINDIKAQYPIPKLTLLLTKGMELQFRHPTEDYSFEFELLSDFSINELNGTTIHTYPKCKVLTWQYRGIAFHIPARNKTLNQIEIENCQKREDKLDKLITNLKNDNVLNITDEMIIGNTSIKNSIWSLKDIINKSGITI